MSNVYGVNKWRLSRQGRKFYTGSTESSFANSSSSSLPMCGHRRFAIGWYASGGRWQRVADPQQAVPQNCQNTDPGQPQQL